MWDDGPQWQAFFSGGLNYQKSDPCASVYSTTHESHQDLGISLITSKIKKKPTRKYIRWWMNMYNMYSISSYIYIYIYIHVLYFNVCTIMYLGTWNIEQRLANTPWRRSQRGERRKHRWAFDHLPGVPQKWMGFGWKKTIEMADVWWCGTKPLQKAIQMAMPLIFLKKALNTNFLYMKKVCERILSGFLKYCHYPHVSSKHSQSPFSAIALKKQKSIDSKEKDANNPKQNPKHITYSNNVVYSQLIGAWFVRGSGHPWIVGPKDGRTTWITI